MDGTQKCGKGAAVKSEKNNGGQQSPKPQAAQMLLNISDDSPSRLDNQSGIRGLTQDEIQLTCDALAEAIEDPGSIDIQWFAVPRPDGSTVFIESYAKTYLLVIVLEVDGFDLHKAFHINLGDIIDALRSAAYKLDAPRYCKTERARAAAFSRYIEGMEAFDCVFEQLTELNERQAETIPTSADVVDAYAFAFARIGGAA
jgi:hypothetical protein